MGTPPGIHLENVTRFFRESEPGGDAPLRFAADQRRAFQPHLSRRDRRAGSTAGFESSSLSQEFRVNALTSFRQPSGPWSSGRRCDSQEFLEFDHVEAWSRTKAHPIDGITLRCRAHNQQRARIDFGEPHMARFHRRGGDDPRSPPLFAAEAEAHHRLRKRFGHWRGRRANLNADT